MKRILILIALIYCANCVSPCESITRPKDATECLGKETENKNNICCFLKYSSDRHCLELPKDESKRDEYIKTHYTGYYGYTRECLATFRN